MAEAICTGLEVPLIVVILQSANSLCCNAAKSIAQKPTSDCNTPYIGGGGFVGGGAGVDVGRDDGARVGVGGDDGGVASGLGVGGGSDSHTGSYSSNMLLLIFRGSLPSAFMIHTCWLPGSPS